MESLTAFNLEELNASLIGKVCFRAKFFGQPAHAAGAPWEGKNALDAAVATYQALAMLRQQMHPTCKVRQCLQHNDNRSRVHICQVI